MARLSWPGRFTGVGIETRHNPLNMEEQQQIVLRAQLYRNNRVVSIALSLPDVAQLERVIKEYRERQQ